MSNELSEALQFVKSAVAKKALSADALNMTHYLIQNGWVTAWNGVMTMSHKIPLDINVMPNATKFLSAINAVDADSPPSLTVTAAGNLVVKGGKFRAVVKCLDVDSHTLPVEIGSAQRYDLESDLIPAFKRLKPFMSEDASRVWSQSIYLNGRSAFATNNIVLVEHALTGQLFPNEVAIPTETVMELIRIGEEPDYVLVDKESIAFVFKGGDAWLKTRVYTDPWPDINAILDKACADLDGVAISDELAPAMLRMKPFLAEMEEIYFTGEGISTHRGLDEGARETVPGLPRGPCFINKYLTMVAALPEVVVDWSGYPNICGFSAKNIRGAVLGLREGYPLEDA